MSDARLSEHERVEQLKVGKAEAFAQILDEFGPRMLAVARRMMAHEADAQDCVQDAWVAVVRSIGTFDGRSQLATWIHRIVVNACLMKHRSKSRGEAKSIEHLLPTYLEDGHQRVSTRKWGGPGGSGKMNGSGDWEVKIQGKEINLSAYSEDLLRLINEKMLQLPENYRIVLVLRDIEEMSTASVAHALDITQDAVKTRLHRARQALRTLLESSFTSRQET